MAILYVVGLVLALIIGGAIALLLKGGYYERIASKRGEYEKEIDERGDFDAAVAVFRRITPTGSRDHEASAA